MPLLKQDFFLEQPYSYCTYLGRIQSSHSGVFSTDKFGFRTSFYNNQKFDLKYFNTQISKKKIFVAGNSVPYGVSILNDKSVIHNNINNISEYLGYNLSLRASTMFQDFICLSRCVQDEDAKIIWIAGLNDILSIFLGDYSHPLFPPWFGEQNLSSHKWQRESLNLSFKAKFQLLVDSITQLLKRLSMSNKVIFIWQPLWNLRKSPLSQNETANIEKFLKRYSGKLGKLYNTKDVQSTYLALISYVENYFDSTEYSESISFINSNNILPQNTLSDVTHLNEDGHLFLAKLVCNL